MNTKLTGKVSNIFTDTKNIVIKSQVKLENGLTDYRVRLVEVKDLSNVKLNQIFTCDAYFDKESKIWVEV